MKSWTTRGLSPLLALLLAGGPWTGPAHAASTQTPTVVNRLTTYVPSRPTFTLHGTLPIAPRPFDRVHCPYQVVAPDGTLLPTQWELVARLRDRMVVELTATVTNNPWYGQKKNFWVIESPAPFHLNDYDTATLAVTALPDRVELQIQDQGSTWHSFSLSGLDGTVQYHRFGPARITFRKVVDTPFGAIQAWWTVNAAQQEIELTLNWNNGTLNAGGPQLARPDVFFKAARLQVPSGWRWELLMPDAVAGGGHLVQPGAHVIPQRMERSFRVRILPVGQTALLSGKGWAVADWSAGGYMAQDIALPDLSHTTIDLTPEKVDAFQRLANFWPTFPGDPPVSPLWPARGVQYGGMTGGIDVEQIPAVPLAYSGQPDGLLRLYCEQLRYASRHMGCIYAPDGLPIRLDDYLNGDGTTPWRMFNNRFEGNPPLDAPFRFSQAGAGVGWASYDPLVFDPIDSQHLVRRTKANKALVWLDNDPLARLYLMMDAELARMMIYEGPDGRLNIPSTPALGTAMGRAEGWLGDVRAHAYAIGSDNWRVRNFAWFWKYRAALQIAQMPNDLFSAVNDGKIADDPPYGDGVNAFYWVHRSNEQVFLALALRGIQETVGLDCSPQLRRVGEGMWSFAWKVGTPGPLSRYPAGPNGVPRRWATRDEIPFGLTSTVDHDGYHVGTLLGFAHEEGADMLAALLAYTSTTSAQAALNRLESWGLDNIANRANMIAILQDVLE